MLCAGGDICPGHDASGFDSQQCIRPELSILDVVSFAISGFPISKEVYHMVVQLGGHASLDLGTEDRCGTAKDRCGTAKDRCGKTVTADLVAFLFGQVSHVNVHQLATNQNLNSPPFFLYLFRSLSSAGGGGGTSAAK
jgi:hypothetical protein